jgi:hypothetical protein
MKLWINVEKEVKKQVMRPDEKTTEKYVREWDRVSEDNEEEIKEITK